MTRKMDIEEINCPNCGCLINIEEIIRVGTEEKIKEEVEIQRKKYEQEIKNILKQKEDIENNLAKKYTSEFEKKYQDLKEKQKNEMSRHEKLLRENLAEEQKEASALIEKELALKTEQLKELNKLKVEKAQLEREKDSMESSFEAKYQSILKQKEDIENNLAKKYTSEFEKKYQDLKEKQKNEMSRHEKLLRENLAEEQKEASALIEKELALKTEQLKELNKLKVEKAQLEREKDSMESSFEAKYQSILTDWAAKEKIKIKQEMESNHELKILEYKKQIEDQKKLIEEIKQKNDQLSVQFQGEIQEIAIENYLSNTFRLDTIKEISKGDMGADCLQVINTRDTINCGSIYYESKRTKKFSLGWIEKFKKDIQDKGADIGVLVSQTYPDGMDRMGVYQGIYICSYDEFKGLSIVLRESIIKINQVQKQQENKSEKAILLYDFLMSMEFQIQVEGIVNAFKAMKVDLDAEKNAMQKIWKKREKQLDIVTHNTVSMIGSIQGLSKHVLEKTDVLQLENISDTEEDII